MYRHKPAFHMQPKKMVCEPFLVTATLLGPWVMAMGVAITFQPVVAGCIADSNVGATFPFGPEAQPHIE